MEYRNLGKTGLKVSELCLGSMQFGWTADEKLAYEILNAAYAAGINFIDTADIYSRWADGNPGGVAETIIGKWLKKFNVPRDQVIIATKVRGPMGDTPNDEGLSRYHIMRAVEASLRRLNIDYIDLYQTHWYDENTPIEETLRALDDLIDQGKVRYIGASNYPAWRLMQALWASDKHKLASYVSLQPHYNLAHRKEFERELAGVCKTYSIGVIPYSPLAAGFLTGKYRKDELAPDSVRANSAKRRYFNKRGWAILDAVQKVADNYAVSVSRVALAWLLANPIVASPIIGPRTLTQLEDNLGGAGLQLGDDEKAQLDEVSMWEK
ncbi:MAG: aldo/keto reductase [Anaerolineales bacterium]|nr:aldo/keto reductase [Anaerolineales bacterium]